MDLGFVCWPPRVGGAPLQPGVRGPGCTQHRWVAGVTRSMWQVTWPSESQEQDRRHPAATLPRCGLESWHPHTLGRRTAASAFWCHPPPRSLAAPPVSRSRRRPGLSTCFCFHLGKVAQVAFSGLWLWSSQQKARVQQHLHALALCAHVRQLGSARAVSCQAHCVSSDSVSCRPWAGTCWVLMSQLLMRNLGEVKNEASKKHRGI